MFKNKIYLVTGASSGIGAAVAQLLLEEGAQVLAVSRRNISNEIPSSSGTGARLQYIQCDLSDFTAADRVIKRALKSIPALAGAVLCHGFGDFGSIEEFSVSRIKKLIDTNFTSTILLSRLVIPAMKKHNCGDLIFIGSEAGLKGGKRGAVYSAAKFGLRGFAQALRQECASSGVRVSIVNPGMVNTRFFDELDFSPGESRDNALQAVDVAGAVKSIISMPAGSVIDEINLSPLTTVIRNKSKIP